MTTGFSHPALLYRDWAEYVEQLGRFVHAELVADHPVAVALPDDHLRRLRRELGLLSRRVRWLDMSVAGRNPGRILPDVLLSFADLHSGRRVGIVGEPIWVGRSRDEYEAAVQHEALINLAFADRDATMLCPYDVSALDPAALDDAGRTHPEIVENGVSRASSDYQSPAAVAADMSGPLPDPPADAPALVVSAVDDLPRVQDFVEIHGTRLGLPGGGVDRLDLAVHEAVTNTVTHSGGGGVVRIWREGDEVICAVRDRGHIDDPLVGRRPGAKDREDGYGLLLVNQVCDLVRLHSDASGTDLRMHIAVADGRPV